MKKEVFVFDVFVRIYAVCGVRWRSTVFPIVLLFVSYSDALFCLSTCLFQVRLSVLQSLTPEFDRYLARAQHVSTLLLLLADEVR